MSSRQQLAEKTSASTNNKVRASTCKYVSKTGQPVACAGPPYIHLATRHLAKESLPRPFDETDQKVSTSSWSLEENLRLSRSRTKGAEHCKINVHTPFITQRVAARCGRAQRIKRASSAWPITAHQSHSRDHRELSMVPESKALCKLDRMGEFLCRRSGTKGARLRRINAQIVRTFTKEVLRNQKKQMINTMLRCKEPSDERCSYI